ncbi:MULTISPECIES: bile acid:sodium symporter family protein [Pseudomonas]|uniref:Bile acid:sodium symporter n=1 Tax=Pseudomonas quercus TaxID=2722792 RepID=A0ABX0YB02_9PSED|nr:MULTISPECIES: bile acid:sodium symporter family protein [Pseudomonas]MBF7141988.1 bile acid:sodium symporter [Pseudomonas sp. LY10J]NJP00526.1 bile acid:sodium symporter [Pseudomonas quercus]
MSVLKHLKKLVTDWFLCGMVLATLLAWLLPSYGGRGGALHLDKVINIGVFLVFFLHGANLSGEQIGRGLRNWKLHVMVQGFTFVVFPLLWLAASHLGAQSLPPMLMLGFLYLCALPSTISSSVALTGSAKGNVPGAILNASLSSVLGIFITPWLVSLVVGTGQGGIDLGPTLLDLSLMLLAPLVLGQIARRWIRGFIARNKRYTNILDKCVILLLVYSAFCNSMLSGMWQQQSGSVILAAFAGSALLLATVLLMTTRVTRWAGFNHADQVAGVFCASKKSLAAGAPMAALIFGQHPALGLILLPIMIYHPLQLIVCSVMAETYNQRAARLDAALAAP